MKRIEIIILILFFGFGLLYVRNYTYQITTPVDIDPIVKIHTETVVCRFYLL